MEKNFNGDKEKIMNNKNNILEAWILIEELSEGSIKKSEGRVIKVKEEDWKAFFERFLSSQNKVRKNSGIIIYFDVFNSEDVVNILKEKFKIKGNYDEIDYSDKFTFCLYFNNNLEFMKDKTFYTMSGYIRECKELPQKFDKFEEEFKNELENNFKEYGFDKTINKLFNEKNIKPKNCIYKFVENIEGSEANLHSFYIDDLKKAKNITNENLERYFNGFKGERKNLDGNKDSENFNPNIFESILYPTKYPMGRFPSNPDYSLSLMQQVAVNLALNDKNNIRSVNGPPGTGKTTLLKDIFAELIVSQAKEICDLKEKKIKGKIKYYGSATFGTLPVNISKNNIVVASSNNGAVQNIVNELPKIDEIDDTFIEKLKDADYFKDISNLEISVEWDGNKKNIRKEPLEEKNWGTFSMEGGKAENIGKLLSSIEAIIDYLNEEYESNPNVYNEFLELYNKVNNNKKKVEKHIEQIGVIRKIEKEYSNKGEVFKEKEKSQRDNLEFIKINIENENKTLEKQSIDIENKLKNILIELKDLEGLRENIEKEKDKYKDYVINKPSFLWFHKILKSEKFNKYYNEVDKINNETDKIKKQLEDINKNTEKLQNEKNEFLNSGRNIYFKLENNKKQIEDKKEECNKYIIIKQKELRDLEAKINNLIKIKNENNIEELDFSKDYDDIQKSNPWFNKDFRILQSNLFIMSLKIRKEFLYENRKNLKAAYIIWNRKSDYITKENGRELIGEAWKWINFTIPIISTTFASLGRMFKELNEDSIGNLFVDEAGQALPQASVGAILRSEKVMVVGDPSQIKPVLTLDSGILNLIADYYKVDEKFISDNASTQSIVDNTGEYGFQKNEDEWIGIPLWVHRRSNYPMFNVSNEISYEGLMVQGKPKSKAYGEAYWYNSKGVANDKFVQEQSDKLKELIQNKLKEDENLKDEIYVISPFKNVAYKLSKDLEKINFTKREGNKKDGKVINIGTVHTFQGKEAKIVYFVLGADKESKGAAKWAVNEANIMNVAATRAKEEFYVIGDKELYSSLGSVVANKTIEIIDAYKKVY